MNTVKDRISPHDRRVRYCKSFIGRLSINEFNFLDILDKLEGYQGSCFDSLMESLSLSDVAAFRYSQYFKKLGFIDFDINIYTRTSHLSDDKNHSQKSHVNYRLTELGRKFLNEAYEVMDTWIEAQAGTYQLS